MRGVGEKSEMMRGEVTCGRVVAVSWVLKSSGSQADFRRIYCGEARETLVQSSSDSVMEGAAAEKRPAGSWWRLLSDCLTRSRGEFGGIKAD